MFWGFLYFYMCRVLFWFISHLENFKDFCTILNLAALPFFSWANSCKFANLLPSFIIHLSLTLPSGTLVWHSTFSSCELSKTLTWTHSFPREWHFCCHELPGQLSGVNEPSHSTPALSIYCTMKGPVSEPSPSELGKFHSTSWFRCCCQLTPHLHNQFLPELFLRNAEWLWKEPLGCSFLPLGFRFLLAFTTWISCFSLSSGSSGSSWAAAQPGC